MQKQDREILNIIVSISQMGNQSISLTYIFNRLPAYFKKDKKSLLSWISSLENQGYLKTQDVNRRTILITPTQLGISAVSGQKETVIRKDKLLNQWAAIAGVVGTLLAIVTCIFATITFFDDFSKKVRNPASYLIINSASFPNTQEINASVLAQDINPETIDFYNDSWKNALANCIEPSEENCQVVTFAKPLSMIPELLLKVTSRATDTPLSIEGIELELVNFESIENLSINILKTYACGGGGGPNYFAIDYFWLGRADPVVDLSTEFDGGNPEQAIGTKVIAHSVCPNGECNANLYVTNQEEEPLVLRMPFLEDFPPGWYGFEAAIAYSYNGEPYISTEKIRFDVVKPEKANSWWSSCNERPSLSFAPIDLEARKILTSSVGPMPDNPLGTLVFSSDASMEEALYALNLQSGELEHIGKLGMLSQINDHTYKPSPSGWQWAFELTNSENPEHPHIDIGIVDIKNGSFLNITRDDDNQNFFPAWNPSGNKIAYVSFSHLGSLDLTQGDADIFIYDIQSGTSKRVTFTPNILEQDPVWLSETSLAYLMPENRSYYGELVVQNSKVGYGIVDLISGDNVFEDVFVDSTANLKFLPLANKLIISDFSEGSSVVSLADGSVFKEPLFTRYACMFLNSLKGKLLCNNGNSGLVLYDSVESRFDARLEINLNDEMNKPRDYLIGEVMPGGFAIADLGQNMIYEYSEEGALVHVWSVTELNRLLFHYKSPYSARKFILIR